MTNPNVPDLDTLGNMRPIQKTVFSIGSNLGDSLETIQKAIGYIGDTPDVIPVDVSSVYRTKPVGPVTDQPGFLNVVLVAETTLEPITLLERIQAIETALGRVRDVPGGPRTIDIDLVMVGRRELATEQLTLPHPHAHERAFVLVPWLEADPLGELAGHGPLVDLAASVDSSGVVRTEDEVHLS